MSFILSLLFNTSKGILFKVATEKLMTTLFFEVAEKLVKSTSNTLDDKILSKIKEEYFKK